MATLTRPLNSGVCALTIILYTLINGPQMVTGLSQSDVDHHCMRPCDWPSKPRTCRYEFTVEWSYSMSKACFNCPFNVTDCYRPHCLALDGAPRAVAVVNKQFPGPSIQVCEHDQLSVQVNNYLVNAEGVTIHWHGLHQRGTPYMDGTSQVTQCNIPTRSSFTYEFLADTPGTHWWHSHTGMQRSDGVFGPLIIKQAAPDDPHSGLYDYDLPEHVVVVHDWFHEVTVNRFAGHHLSTLSGSPDSILVNGRGQSIEYTMSDSNQTYKTPRKVFHVDLGKRYRFRTISNAILDCPIEVSLDKHNLTVIASDGSPFEPVQVARYVIYGGERFDFVLTADRAVGRYWMRFKGLGLCSGVQGLAMVVYNNVEGDEDLASEDYPGIAPEEILLNPFNLPASETVMTVDQLVAIEKKAESLENNDRTFYIAMDFRNITNPNYNHPDYYPVGLKPGHFVYTSQLNFVAFVPPGSPPLTQLADIPEFELCSFESTEAKRDHCKEAYCECTHYLEVELGEVVELVLVDEGIPFEDSHPMHLHGYSFQVVAMGKIGDSTTVEEVKRLDQAGGINRNFVKAPRKDTVIVPDGGYTVVRFAADNPGWWLFHCHLQFHSDIGMAIVLHVGKDQDLPPKPKDFPRCGNWYPHGNETDKPPPSQMPSSALRSTSSMSYVFMALNSCMVVAVTRLGCASFWY
ncbi:uncharacterized protein [Asterias amurensis]|uniref:uncharacterized protein n=1 Tax=Asterias amurensis TaxID=7602 RepID=UPI003AB11B1F